MKNKYPCKSICFSMCKVSENNYGNIIFWLYFTFTLVVEYRLSLLVKNYYHSKLRMIFMPKKHSKICTKQAFSLHLQFVLQIE